MASGIDPLVQDIGVCLVGAGVLSVLFERLKIPHVAAFLAAGFVLGPSGLSAVTDAQNIETIAHLGLTLLLFLIGLEVDLRALLGSGRTMLVGGLFQVPLSVAAALLLFALPATMGMADADGYTALYLAFTCAFSSTLLAVKLLQQHLRLDSFAGRTSVGLLIFQDLWAMIVLALQPNLTPGAGGPDLAPIVLTFVGIVLVGVLATGFARYVLPGAFARVAKMPELVVIVALAWCFGLGLVGANLGTLLHLAGLHVPVSVSLEMGALVAGASIANLPYAYDVVGKIGNLRDFFVTLFFVALGMGIPIPEGPGVLWQAAGIVVATMVVRALVFVPLLYAGGLGRRHAVETSVYLAQVSEFCLVIAYLGQSLGHVSRDVVTAITLAFVATAVGTPFLFSRADRVDGFVGPLLARLGMWRAGEGAGPADTSGRPPRLVLLGFHRVASSLLHDLERQHPEMLKDTRIVDFNVSLHDAIRKTGASVVYGDLASPETLKHAGLASAEVIVSTVTDDLLKGTSNLAIARMAKALAPDALVIVNAVRAADVPKMYEAGADYVFMWRTETAIGLWSAIDAALNGNLVELLATRRLQYGRIGERTEVLP